MIVATHQPIFLPWPGLFYKALAADALVLLDGVQHPQSRGWMTRNRVKSDQGELWLHVPVYRKGHGLQRIHEVEIRNDTQWRHKHLQSIRQAYGHAPYLAEIMPTLESIYAREQRRLIELNLDLLRLLWWGMGMTGRLVLQSELGVRGQGSELLTGVCRALDADTYVTLPPAARYLDADTFERADVTLRYIDFDPPVYPQLWGPFRYNLSALDLLLCCGPKAREIIEEAGDSMTR